MADHRERRGLLDTPGRVRVVGLCAVIVVGLTGGAADAGGGDPSPLQDSVYHSTVVDGLVEDGLLCVSHWH